MNNYTLSKQSFPATLFPVLVQFFTEAVFATPQSICFNGLEAEAVDVFEQFLIWFFSLRCLLSTLHFLCGLRWRVFV